jgi:hypothetical protein
VRRIMRDAGAVVASGQPATALAAW